MLFCALKLANDDKGDGNGDKDGDRDNATLLVVVAEIEAGALLLVVALERAEMGGRLVSVLVLLLMLVLVLLLMLLLMLVLLLVLVLLLMLMLLLMLVLLLMLELVLLLMLVLVLVLFENTVAESEVAVLVELMNTPFIASGAIAGGVKL